MMPTEAVREALRQLPKLAATSVANKPDLTDVYFPLGHAECLDPDVSLVIGNRGMGKTFWTLALGDREVREGIAKRLFLHRKFDWSRLNVSVGFGDAEGGVGVVGSAVLKQVKNYPSDIIWRAVMLRVLAPIIDQTLIPEAFVDLVDWVNEHPEEQSVIFRRVDQHLNSEGATWMVLFDQLDQLADDWSETRDLTQGLIRVALAMKSYRSIKVKLFMRPDQGDDRNLFRFPDASKILNGRQILSWRAHDLYGLLFFEVAKNPRGRLALDSLCGQLNIPRDVILPASGLPMLIATSGVEQGAMFDAIAGEFMGKGSKRGRPYTWLPVHLADARGEISPRTFLQVMKTAAEWPVAPNAVTAIDYKGISEGVRRASSTRLAELEEDYPWVSAALRPLRGLLVPCEQVEIEERWTTDKTPAKINQAYRGTQAPLELSLAEELGASNITSVLLELLIEIGVLERRKNGKINVPDIFRVDAGILRKGGVPPQERGRL